MTNEARYDLMVYSPVNWMMVDWAFNGQKFNRCGLPHPRPHGPTTARECQDPCDDLPIPTPIQTYDWARWVPEIIVGLDEPSEEIAADYSRASAIEFCKYTRALQREIVFRGQTGQNRYPVSPVEFENVVGLIGVQINRGSCCPEEFSSFYFDPSVSELVLKPCRTGAPKDGDIVRALVYAAPKEDACEYDSFLYQFFREPIVRRARWDYAKSVHFRDRQLMYHMNDLKTLVERDWLVAKRRVAGAHSFDAMQAAPAWAPLWG